MRRKSHDKLSTFPTDTQTIANYLAPFRSPVPLCNVRTNPRTMSVLFIPMNHCLEATRAGEIFDESADVASAGR